jgi:predicted nucleotide-binding protein
MTALRTPRILIASSKEGLDLAQELQHSLSPDVQATLWDKKFFKPGEYPIETFDRRTAEFDGAVTIATPDDRVVSRKVQRFAPRDNVLFEFGFLVAVLGRRRSVLILEGLGDTKIPSDVLGLTCIPLERTDPLSDGVGVAATEIKDLAQGWRNELLEPFVEEQLTRVLRTYLSEVQKVANIRDHLGIHVFVVDKRSSPYVLKRSARARSSPKSAKLWEPFEKGVGIVGSCWQKGVSVFVDFTKPTFAGATKGRWDRKKDDDKFGMDYEMLDFSRKRSKAVGAVSITTFEGDGEFLACLSYNLGIRSDADPNLLQANEVEHLMDTAAELVATVLEPHLTP